MLGGYRGSVLRDAKTHKRLWIPLKVGFGLRKADLGLGLEPEDELRSAETVIATSMLAQVGGWIDLGKKLKSVCSFLLSVSPRKGRAHAFFQTGND